ncbi:hypothetical protein K438DRAFT_1964442 [Mycena galopus ATCC 62051]|nr:hypothetical protein K438DRAFT_1964442 [Mycena galopus ATCC 62051]
MAGRYFTCPRLCFFGLAVLGFLWLFILPHEPHAHRAEVPIHAPRDELGRPTFGDIKLYEQNLPQLHLGPLSSKGTDRPRYLFFPGAQQGVGWNNVFQEQLLNNYLAYLSQRAYVFPQFIPSDHPPFPDTLPNGTRSMLKIPINALISGPTGGGPLSYNGQDTLVRRAIPEESWNAVCPPEEVAVLNLHQTMHELGVDGTTDGDELMSRWARKLLKLYAPCVIIEGGSIFDSMQVVQNCGYTYIVLTQCAVRRFTGSTRVLSLWPSYGQSPILKYFAWSPLVTASLFQNFHLLSENNPLEFLAPRSRRFLPLRPSEPPIAGLLGIHVRRGDFENHCVFLAELDATYETWNALGNPGLDSSRSTPPGHSWPALPDYLDVPAGQSRRDAAFAHCWPSPEAIVARVHKVRADAPYLRKIYISTNGDASWVAHLAALLRADGWESVSSSLDMVLTLEAQAVSQAVDMGVLTVAEAFVGVGFSSLTSNVVQIRLAAGRPPDTIHFW